MNQDAQKPKISLILVCATGAADLVVPMAGLIRQTIVSDIELILVAAPGALAPDLKDKYPQFHSVQILDYPMPAWRGVAAEIGIRAARAPVIGFHENHTMSEPHMYEMMLAELAGDTVAVAPVFYIANPERPWANAIFIVTHGHSAPDVPEGPKDGLVNFQAIYPADIVKPRAGMVKDEQTLQAELARDVGKLAFCPEAVMWHIESANALTCLKITYIMGRQFGWSRSRDWSMLNKLIRLAAVPVIMGMSSLRYVRRMMEIRETPKQRITVGGCLLLMGAAFGLGEVIGYFVGNDPLSSWVEEHEFHILKRLDGTMPQRPAIRDAIEELKAIESV